MQLEQKDRDLHISLNNICNTYVKEIMRSDRGELLSFEKDQSGVYLT